MFQNVGRYGNTSSASLLIAACEWWRESGASSGAPIVFGAFGAGLNWGALLAAPCRDAGAPSRDTAKEG
jgi:3-oxoacyl-[acyl-carrier-protein] synthase-3